MSRSIDVRNIPAGAKLELFVHPACPYCRDAMAYYDAHETPYVAYDAQNDRVLRSKMFAYTGNDPTVPAIVVDGAYAQSGWGEPPRG